MADDTRNAGRADTDSRGRRPQPPQKPPSLLDQFRRPGFWIGLIAVFVVNYLVINVFLAPQQPQQVTISYTEFKKQVDADNVVSVSSQGDAITGVTKKAVSGQANGASAKATHFATQRPTFASDNLEALLERAVAGEANVPFFSVAASEFIEFIVGVGASRVRDLFTKARKAAPAIIFIDELDAIGRSRGAAIRTGGNDEQEQTLNQILTEMDGFDSREGVIVLAATNRADVLDPALLRPGRFDRRVVVQAPDRSGRVAILRIHTKGVPLAPDVDLEALASQTPGFVGADLRNLVNEAALLAARRDRDAVTMADFTE